MFPPGLRHARTDSRSPGATDVGRVDVNGRRVEPVPSERPRRVCSPPPPRFFVPSVKATQEILCSLRAGPVSTTRRRSVNSGQSHRPCLPTTKAVGEYVLVTTCRESHRLAGEKTMWKNPTSYCDCKTIKEKSKITASKQQHEAEMCGSSLAH